MQICSRTDQFWNKKSKVFVHFFYHPLNMKAFQIPDNFQYYRVLESQTSAEYLPQHVEIRVMKSYAQLRYKKAME